MNSEDTEKEKLDKGLPDGGDSTFAATSMPQSTKVSSANVSLSNSSKRLGQSPSDAEEEHSTKPFVSGSSESASFESASFESSQARPNQATSTPVSPSVSPSINTAVNKSVTQRKGMGTFSKLVITLSLLCALAAGGAVAWLWFADQQNQMQQQLALQTLDNTLQDQRRQISALTTQLNQLNSEGSKQIGALAGLRQSGALLQGRMSSVENQITELTGAHRVDWMLKEAEHFVVVSERRLSLLNDIDGALALLIEADKLVRDMREPSTRKLREALAKDLMALREAAINHVDSEGIFSRIEVLMTKVEGLEKAALTFKAGEEALVVMDSASSEYPVEDKGPLGRFMGKIEEFVGSLVRVRMNDETTIKPLLSADQQAYLRQNIFVLLEQAQLSLLRTDYSGFKISLDQAKKRIEQYLRTDTQEARFVLAELSELAATPMVTTVPSIEASVRALQVFRDYWQQEKTERQLQKNQLLTQPVAEPEPEPVSESESQEINKG